MVNKASAICETAGTTVGEDFIDTRRDFANAFFVHCIGKHIDPFSNQSIDGN